ncbi:hypothetical protein [Pseudomonas sp. CCC3.1]|uniref:hypothetical protein n=1 Tax=Pseudomonas sp. CCC3.1 TaxID=3048607 RepID=UPI002AC91AFD|nr:hypothetical protein [Pseudomonas sp. CCC3.1]MEB0208013.1 hypothetical protein [Pseudomonas sp. CCC3.1]WPX37658.1 hypothetical protein RHM56_05590 [Pseudomonas sp. CCC3.1]
MPSTKLNKLPLTMKAPWTNPEPLPDIPDGETNLLHRSAWSDVDKPLRIEICPWYEFPLDSGTERVDVFLDDDESTIIETRTWTLPMSEDDYYIELGAHKLPEGEHALSYIMTNFLELPARSYPFTLTVDKTSPRLAADSALIFPSEVKPPQSITAAYLAHPLNNDQVLASLPDYTDKKVGDVITWYWGISDSDFEQVDTLTLAIDDINGVLPKLTFTGDMIRDSGDGQRFALYQIEDRAGNISVLSDAAELNVNADPIPRVFPWPTIQNADSTGKNQILNPLIPYNYYVVEVPESAVIYPDDKLWVQWGDPNTFGAGRFDVPLSSNPLHFKIPMPSVAAYLGKTLQVYYGVEGVLETSDQTRLRVMKVEPTSYPPIQCEGTSGSTLKYSNIKADGAALTIEQWSLMTTDQVVQIKITGVSNVGNEAEVLYLPEYSVVESDLTHGIGLGRTIRVEKSFFNKLKRGENLTVRVFVSFDQGVTWPIIENFTKLYIKLSD